MEKLKYPSHFLLLIAMFCSSTFVFAQDPLTKPPKKTQQQATSNTNPVKPQKINRPTSQSTPTVQSVQTPVRIPASGTINGRDYVNLGLSVKWAICNVGASDPSDYGNYYAWGETSPKTTYTEENCTTYKKNMGDIGGSRYDAARVNWGATWRLPTYSELTELEEKCKWAWTSQGGHYGYRVTGPSGQYIFLPAAGYRSGSSLIGAGVLGDCWSSTPYESNTEYASYLYLGSSDYDTNWGHRYYGQSVRPVSE